MSPGECWHLVATRLWRVCLHLVSYPASCLYPFQPCILAVLQLASCSLLAGSSLTVSCCKPGSNCYLPPVWLSQPGSCQGILEISINGRLILDSFEDHGKWPQGHQRLSNMTPKSNLGRPKTRFFDTHEI